MKQAYLLLGEVLRPQGIRGEVKIHPCSSQLQQFPEYQTVFLKEKDGFTPITVLKARIQKEDVYLQLEGITDRNAAEALRGKEIWIDREHARKLDEGEYFIAELIGSPVQLHTGESFGTLKDVVSTGHVDVFVVETPDGEWSFPALKAVLTEVSPEKIVLDGDKLHEVGLYENRRS